MSSVPKEVETSVPEVSSQTSPPMSTQVCTNPNKHSPEKSCGDEMNVANTNAAPSETLAIAQKPPPPADEPPHSVVIPCIRQPGDGFAASDDGSVRSGLSFLSTGESFMFVPLFQIFQLLCYNVLIQRFCFIHNMFHAVFHNCQIPRGRQIDQRGKRSKEEKKGAYNGGTQTITEVPGEAKSGRQKTFGGCICMQKLD